MTPRSFGWLLPAIILLHSVAVSAADPEAEARQHYDRAVQLYGDGAYDAALVELNRAWELRPSFKLLYNIAQVRVAMNDYAGALQSYRQYLDKGGDKVPGARREAVQKEIKTLEQRVATVSVETDVPGAEVLIDDVVVGTSPFAAPLLVNIGIRRVVVRHPDYLQQSRRVSLTGGAQEKLAFSLVTKAPAASERLLGTQFAEANRAPSGTESATPRAQADPSTNQPQSKPVERRSGVTNTPWLPWSITGALVASATVTSVMALSASASLKDKREQYPADPEQLHSESKRVNTLALVTDGLWLAALAAGGVSLWLTLDPASAQASKTGQLAPPPGRVSVGLGLSELRLKTSF